MDPGSSNALAGIGANQSQRAAACKISPLKPKNSGALEGSKVPTIRSRLTLKSGTMTEGISSATESKSNSRAGLPTMSAQEAKLASEINKIDQKLKRRV